MTESESTAAATPPNALSEESQAPPSRRARCYLTELPDDFLRLDVSYPADTQGGRLVPVTYTPQTVYRPPSNHVGKLKVTVSQGKLARNYGFTRMDPYCRIRVGHSVYETPTDTNGSKNPRWNKSFTCNLSRGVRSLYIEVFNERYLAVDDRIAWGYYEFPEDLFNGETVEEWIPLSGRQGDNQEGNINLIFSFTPAPQQTAYQISAYGTQPVSVVPGPPQVHYPPMQVPQPVSQTGASEPMQGPVTGAPVVREEDVKQLKEMFPSLEEEVVRSVLEASHGQVNSAVNSLLQMTAAE